jgi:uncharacterized membrane protein
VGASGGRAPNPGRRRRGRRGPGPEQPGAEQNGEDTGLTHRDDDKYWRGGLIYINAEDRTLLVPRRFGLGWTLNFGDPRAAILITGVVAQISLVITLSLSD